LSRIYALLSVKFSGLKMCGCKKSDKYEVWTHIINSTHIQSLTRILNLNREENEIYVSDSHKSRREREFFLQNLENREEKENENSIFFEREGASEVSISRDFSRFETLVDVCSAMVAVVAMVIDDGGGGRGGPGEDPHPEKVLCV